MSDWVRQHWEQILWALGMSAAALVLSAVVAAVVIVRLPADFLTDEGRRRREEQTRRRGWTAGRIAKNVLGWLLIAAGVAMLVLPGQGMLVALIGVMLAEFPGKERVERAIMSRPTVLRTMNAVRRWFGKERLAGPDRGQRAV